MIQTQTFKDRGRRPEVFCKKNALKNFKEPKLESFKNVFKNKLFKK